MNIATDGCKPRKKNGAFEHHWDKCWPRVKWLATYIQGPVHGRGPILEQEPQLQSRETSRKSHKGQWQIASNPELHPVREPDRA